MGDQVIEMPARDVPAAVAGGEALGYRVDEGGRPAVEFPLQFFWSEDLAADAFAAGLERVVPFEEEEEVFQRFEFSDVVAFDDGLHAVADETALCEDLLFGFDGVLPFLDGHLRQCARSCELFDGVDFGWGFGVEVGFGAGFGVVD